MRHARYVVDRIGVDHVALGSDFDGATIPDDLGDVSDLPRLIEAFRDAGFEEKEVEQIAYRNWIRVLERRGEPEACASAEGEVSSEGSRLARTARAGRDVIILEPASHNSEGVASCSRSRGPCAWALLSLIALAAVARHGVGHMVRDRDRRTHGAHHRRVATCVPQGRFADFPAQGLMDIQAIIVPGIGVAAAQAGVDNTRENQRLIYAHLTAGAHPKRILELLKNRPQYRTPPIRHHRPAGPFGRLFGKQKRCRIPFAAGSRERH